MTYNPLLDQGPLGVHERRRQRLQNPVNPYAEANALLRQTTESNLAMAQQLAEEARKAEEQARKEEAERQARERAAVQQQVSDIATTYMNPLTNPLYAPLYTQGQPQTQPQGQQPAQANVSSNAVEDKDIYGNPIFLDGQVLLESKDPNALFAQFVKKFPNINERSVKGRRQLVEELFPQFLATTYNIRGQAEKTPNAVQMQEIINHIFQSNPATFEGNKSGAVKDIASTVGAGLGAGISELINTGTHWTRRAFNQVQTTVGLQTKEQHLQDLDEEARRMVSWSQGIRNWRDSVLSEDALDSMKQLEEAEGFGESVGSLIESPLSTLYYVAELGGVGGAGGALLKGGAKVTGKTAAWTGGKVSQGVAKISADKIRMADSIKAMTASMRGSAAAQKFVKWGDSWAGQTAKYASSPGMVAFYSFGGGRDAGSVYESAIHQGIPLEEVHDNSLAAGLTNMGITFAGGAVSRQLGLADIESLFAGQGIRAASKGAGGAVGKTASEGAGKVASESIGAATGAVEQEMRAAVTRGIERAIAGSTNAAANKAMAEGGEQVVQQTSRLLRTAKNAGSVARAMGSIAAAAGVEGTEEFLAGLSGAMAVAGMDENGNFSTDNITDEEWAQIYNQAWKEAAIGTVIGGATHSAYKGREFLLGRKQDQLPPEDNSEYADDPDESVDPSPNDPSGGLDVDPTEVIIDPSIRPQNPLLSRPDQRADYQRAWDLIGSMRSRETGDRVDQQQQDYTTQQEEQEAQRIADELLAQQDTNPLVTRAPNEVINAPRVRPENVAYPRLNEQNEIIDLFSQELDRQEEVERVADLVNAPPIDYNLEGVTPEVESKVELMLVNERVLDNGQTTASLSALAGQYDVKLLTLARAVTKRIAETGTLEDHADVINAMLNQYSDIDISRLAVANWVLGKFDVAPQVRNDLARTLMNDPAMNDVLTHAAKAAILEGGSSKKPHTTARANARINTLLATSRDQTFDPTQRPRDDVAAFLEGSGIDQDIADLIQLLPDTHPVKVAMNEANFARTKPGKNYGVDPLYSILSGDNTLPLPRSHMQEVSRLVGGSKAAKQVFADVYRNAVSRMTDHKISPSNIRLTDDVVQTAIQRAAEADESLSDLGTFKSKNDAYYSRLRQVAKQAIDAAKLAVATEESSAKKDSALTKEAQKLGLEQRTRGGRRNPSKAIERAQIKHTNRHSKRLPWESLTPKGQRNAVQQVTAEYIREVAARNWDATIAERVRVVSPDMLPGGEQLNGFTRLNDNYIYVVAHPDMDENLINWTIAHEAAHLGMTLRRADGSTLFSGEEYLAMLEDVATNPTVKALMDAMRAQYPKADHILLAEEAMAELTAAMMTGRWGNLTAKWGVKVPTRFTKPKSAIGRMVQAFREFISRIIGGFKRTRRATDAEVMTYVTRVARAANSSAIEGDMVRYYPEQMAQSHESYSQFAADTIPDWDSKENKDQLLADIAARNGNEEMSVWYRASMRPPPPPKMDDQAQPSEVKRSAKDYNDAQRAAEDFMDTDALLHRQAEGARKAANDTNTDETAKPLDVEVATYFYHATMPGGTKNTDKQGMVIPFKERGEVMVRYALYDEVASFQRDRKVVYKLRQDETFEELIRRAEADVVSQGFELREGVRRRKSYTDTGVEIDNFSQLSMGRITRWEMFSPTFTKLALAVRKVLPEFAEPLLDKVLDMLHYGRALFLSPEDLIASVENAYNIYSNDGSQVSKLNEYLHIQNLRSSLQQQIARFGLKDSPTFLDFKTEFANEVRKYRNVVTREDVERYFHAREAQVRDPEIARRMGLDPDNRNMERLYMPGVAQDTLSGFFTGDTKSGDWMANQYFATEFAKFSPQKRKALENIAKKYMDIVRHSQKLMYLNGIIDEDAFNSMMKRPFWMSLRDLQEKQGRSPRPAGRYSRPTAMIETSVDIMQNNIRASYNQHIYQRLARIAMLAPNNDFFEILPLNVTRTGEGAYDFEYLTDDESGSRGKDTRVVKMDDGTFVLLKFKNQGLELLKPTYNTNKAMQGMQNITSYLGMFKTSLSPSFIAVTGPRDALTTFLNIQGAIGADLLSTRDAPRVAMAAIKYGIQYYTRLVKAGLSNDFSKDPFVALYHSEGAGLAFGAQVGFDEVQRELAGAFNSDKTGTFGRQFNMMADKTKQQFKRGVQGISFAPEQMFRIGAMRAYMEHLNRTGHLKINDWTDASHMRDAIHQNSELRARLINATKDITTNFERKGTAKEMRAFYVFFNAAMQGMFRTVPQIMASEHGRRGVMMLGGLLFMQAMMAMSMLGDDEDGEDRYLRMRGRDRKRYIGDGLALPLSPDMMWVAAIADNAAAVALGKRNLIDASGDIMGAAGRSAVPLNWWHTDDSMTNVVGGLVPTAFIPVMADMLDVNYFGNKLVKDKVFDPITGQQITAPTNLEASPTNASDAGMAIAQMMSHIGVDKSGAEVDVWMDSALGGLWSVLSRTQRAQGEGAGLPEAAFSAVFSGYQMKPNTFAVKDTADAIAARAAQLSRKLVPSGGKVDLTADQRKEYEAYEQIRIVAERVRKQAKNISGSHGKASEVWALYKRAKAEGDYTAAAMYKDQYDQLADMQDKLYGLITLKAKELGIYDDLK